MTRPLELEQSAHETLLGGLVLGERIDPDDLCLLRDAAFAALFTAQAALVSSARRHRPDSDYHRDVEGRVIAWHRRLLESVRSDDLSLIHI